MLTITVTTDAGPDEDATRIILVHALAVFLDGTLPAVDAVTLVEDGEVTAPRPDLAQFFGTTVRPFPQITIRSEEPK